MADIQITLDRDEIGQLLDGVDVLIEQWEATEAYLSTGEIDENVCIREAHHAHEAASIAQAYRELGTKIRRQFSSQRR